MGPGAWVPVREESAYIGFLGVGLTDEGPERTSDEMLSEGAQDIYSTVSNFWSSLGIFNLLTHLPVSASSEPKILMSP